MASPCLSVWEKAVTQLSFNARHFSSSPYALVPFNLLPQCWSLQGVSLSKFVCGFFKQNCLELQKLLPLTQSLLVFAARSCGDLPSWHWNPGLGRGGGGEGGWPGVGLGLLTPEKISLLNFYPPHMDQPILHLHPSY